MTSAEYWAKREAEALKHYVTDEKEYQRQLNDIYSRMLDSCTFQINSFYGKYAAKEGITLAEAKKRVAELDIKAYERKAAQYVKEKNFSAKANEEMRLYNATMKINRLEMLKANIGLELIAGHDELDKFMGGILKGRTMEELERQAGILGKTVRGNVKKANAIVNASFHNAKFSDRIWMNQDLLKADLSKLLQSGLIQGRNPRELAKQLKQHFKTSTYNAERLMRTELARVQTEAQKQSFIENGIAEYEFIVNGGCCEICEGLKGKHFKVEKMMPGTNAPPMHPNCRCSTAAHEDEDDFEAWLSALEKGETTEEYNKRKALNAYNEQLESLDTVEKLTAEKEKWLKEHYYDMYGETIEQMEKGFWEEAADGSLAAESAYLKAINQKINSLITNNSAGIGIIQSGNPPIVVGGTNVTITEQQFGFHDGAGGVKKTAPAVIYTTPDGTQFVFPKTYNKARQTMTPEQAISAWQRVPQSIRNQAQKTIEFVDYYNPCDAHWRKIYKNFRGHSYATGGQKITFYRYDYAHDPDYVTRTYCHEAGHFIDTNLATSAKRFSEEPLWRKAMSDDLQISKKVSCTKYGENSSVEDFAESIAEYVKDKAAFTKEYPNRAAILAGIIK